MTAWGVGSSVRSLPSPPPTLYSCTKYKAPAIAPQSQRHACQILLLTRSLLPQSRRISPFRRPVSAAKNSVPGSSFGDWFDHCGGACSLVQIVSTIQSYEFGLRRRLRSLSPILAFRLCIPKFRSPRRSIPFGNPGVLGLSAEKTRNHPSCRRWNCRHFSARFHRKDKDLAGINTIWISDLVPVGFVNDCVSHARAVGDTADVPEAVAPGYDRGRNLGPDHGGR
jgi:hypothetical protein